MSYFYFKTIFHPQYVAVTDTANIEFREEEIREILLTIIGGYQD